MPKQTGTSQLSALSTQLGAVYRKRAGTQTAADTGMRLPAGIQNGVAQLKTCHIVAVKEGGKNAGKLQFYADAVIKSPAKHEGTPVLGLLTRTIIPLYDTPGRTKTTAADHYDTVMETVTRLLGKDQIGEEVSPENIEATMLRLTKAKPHFRFRTWVGNKQVIAQGSDGKWRVYDEDKNGSRTLSKRVTGVWSSQEAAIKGNPYAGRDPMVNEVWGSVVEFSADASANGHPGVVDETAATEEDFPETGGEESAAEDESVDLEELVKMAEGTGKQAEAAEERFLALAEAVGIDEDTVRQADSWSQVAKMIEEASSPGAPTETEEDEEDEEEDDESTEEVDEEEEEEEDEEEEESDEPSVGDVVDHTVEVVVVNKKTKKKTRQKKKVSCEITAVNAKKETATLKNLDDGKTVYKDVPWGDLSQE